MQVGVERRPGELDRLPDPIGARRARPLVQEDRGRRARGGQGSCESSCSMSASS